MNFDPAFDARSERVKVRAAIAANNDKPSDFESQIQAAFDEKVIVLMYYRLIT